MGEATFKVRHNLPLNPFVVQQAEPRQALRAVQFEAIVIWQYGCQRKIDEQCLMVRGVDLADTFLPNSKKGERKGELMFM